MSHQLSEPSACPDRAKVAAREELRSGNSDRLLRLPQVIERVGLKRTAIYQRMREGRFPRSRSLGTRCTVWVESEVDQWVLSVKLEKATKTPSE